MKLGRIAQQAKRMIDKRGGTEALKQDARELQDIAKGKGTVQEKAKRAANALKEPGSRPSTDGPPLDESEVRSGGTHPDDGSHTPPGSTGKTPPPSAG